MTNVDGTEKDGKGRPSIVTNQTLKPTMSSVLPGRSRFECCRAGKGARAVVWGLLVLVMCAGAAGPAVGQPLHGEVQTVDADEIRIELADSLTVADGVEGRVVREQTVGGEVAQMTFALIVVERVERPAEGPWVAVGRIERRSGDVEAGDGVRFAEVEQRSALVVQSTPTGAAVSLDGDPAGSTPVQRPIEAGTYEVRLEKEGYAPAERTVSIDPGERYEMAPTLETATGTLVVNTLPDSASVQFGEQDLGSTPIETDVRTGTDTLTVHRDGYLSVERRVEVRRNEETRVNVTLRRPLQVELAESQSDALANVRLRREEDRLVVQYDLRGESDEYEVELLLSTDGGTSFEPLPEAVEGQVGEGVTPGSDRQLVWAALEDFPRGFSGSGNQLRVAVEPDGGGGVLWVVGSALVAGAGATAAAVLGVFGGESGGDGLPDSPPPPPE